MKGVITSPVIYYYYMSNCSSTGDILREIDSRSLIESSCFLLVNCGAITNLDITELWKEQKARYKQSPFNIMTSVFTHMPYYKGVHRKRDIALALTESNQILAYKNMNESDCFSVLTESVLENNTVLSSFSPSHVPQTSIRYDVAPAGIHMCSRDVLVQFSDNYDYKDITEDYLTNEVNNITFGYKYYAYFNDNSYACFIHVGCEIETLIVIGLDVLQASGFRYHSSLVLSDGS